MTITDDLPARELRGRLDDGSLAAEQAIEPLARLARGAPVRSQRLEACRLLGDIAGRAFAAGWEAAERAAFELLSLARQADAPQDRRGLVSAMGRGFRNVWLVPFVHRRLSDRDESVVAAAINAAGGLGFPALEEAIAAFLEGGAAPALRRAAIASLGRMGAMSAAQRLVAVLGGDDAREAAAALAALTEMRSAAGAAAAAELLEREPEREVLFAAVRYLASLGSPAVLPSLRRLARDDDPDLRLLARSASLVHQAERDHDTGERFLVALTEPDRAVRAALARRLRTRPIAEVLEQAEVLVADDAAGVVQVLGELRAPEVTRHLLALAARADLDLVVRTRAVGAIEADLEWEREALAALACSDAPAPVRAAAAQTLGAFASAGELFDRIGALAAAGEAELRGAFLWALQLAVRPGALPAAERGRAASAVEPLLADPDLVTRRRAAYVAGNLGLDELAPALAALARREARADVRLAALVALAELAPPAVFRDLLAVLRGEKDAAAFAAASRALAAIALADRSLDLGAARRPPRRSHGAPEPLLREAALRLAGLAGGAVAAAAVARLATDPVPAVRAEALTALGRIGGGEDSLVAAFQDPDPALHERAASALLAVGGRRALEQVLEFVAGEGDPESRAAIAPRIAIPPPEVAHFLPRVDAALDRVAAERPGLRAAPRHQGRAARGGARRRRARSGRARRRHRRRLPLLRPHGPAGRLRLAGPLDPHRRVALPRRGRPERRRPVAAHRPLDEGAGELRPRLAGQPGSAACSAIRCRSSPTSTSWSSTPGRPTSGSSASAGSTRCRSATPPSTSRSAPCPTRCASCRSAGASASTRSSRSPSGPA